MTFLHAVLHPGGEAPAPTVIALHGHGANALDLIALSQLLGDELLWICPQAPVSLQPSQGFHGFTWYSFNRDDPRRDDEVDGVVAELHAFVDQAVERYPVDPERLVLLGFSQGGMLAYRMALGRPERFAGLAALSTTLSSQSAEALTPLSDQAKALPVLIQHGTQDQMISVERARESRDQLRDLGASYEYREYEMAHQIGAESSNDLAVWLASVLRLRRD